VAEEKLTIRSFAHQSTPSGRVGFDKPDLDLNFSDRVARLLRIDLTLQGFKLYFIVTPGVRELRRENRSSVQDPRGVGVDAHSSRLKLDLNFSGINTLVED